VFGLQCRCCFRLGSFALGRLTLSALLLLGLPRSDTEIAGGNGRLPFLPLLRRF